MDRVPAANESYSLSDGQTRYILMNSDTSFRFINLATITSRVAMNFISSLLS